jgi:protein translocase SecG subunit
MFTPKIVATIQIVISALLVGSILLQQKGGGLGNAFGGIGTSYHTKRGFEKVLFISTITLGVLFIALNIVSLLLSQ